MKIPYKGLLLFTSIVIICLLIWNAIFEDDPFVWEWHYIFNAYLFPVTVYFIAIFLVSLIVCVFVNILVAVISKITGQSGK